jgi:hypothetical protein
MRHLPPGRRLPAAFLQGLEGRPNADGKCRRVPRQSYHGSFTAALARLGFLRLPEAWPGRLTDHKERVLDFKKITFREQA